MSWVRLDDAFPSHRKIRRLSDAAFRMQVSALCWASKYLTDGHIPADDLEMVADLDDHQDPQAFLSVTKELVQRGVWHEAKHNCQTCPTADDGWIIHDYLNLNPTASEVQRQRSLATERKRRQRERQDGGGSDDDPDGASSVTPSVTRDSRGSHGARHAPVTVPHSHSHSHSQTQRKNESPTKSSTVADDADFDRFWSGYPRKDAKGGARKAWTSALKKATADEIVAGVERYRDRVRNTERRFICTPAKWLNDERWSDEPAPADSPRTNSSASGWAPHRNHDDPHAFDGYRPHHRESTDDVA